MSMPQGGEPGRPEDTGQQTEMPGQRWAGRNPVPGQSGTAGQGGIPSQAGPHDQEWPGQQDQSRYGVPPQGTDDAQWGSAAAGRPISPVTKAETRVTGRRAVQYIIDAIIFDIVAAVIAWAVGRGTGGVHAFLVFLVVVLDVAWYLLYWALLPHFRGGQTLGMQAMGIRVISADGGRASFLQLAVRSVLLVLFHPLSVLVGWIVMMFSRYRQRTGDHMARTVVVRRRRQPLTEEYAGAGHVRRM
jgi:uncharacterized RDD family membrane protein YckC